MAKRTAKTPRSAKGRQLGGCVALLVGGLLAVPGLAQPEGSGVAPGASAEPAPAAAAVSMPSAVDYDVENRDWNGLSELFRTERLRGHTLRVDTDIDLTRHSPDVPIALIYPTQTLPVEDLVAFVEAGGRLLVADDFGTASALMQALGITRLRGTAPQRELLRGNEDLPVLRAAATNPLLAGVRVVVANHPAILSVPLMPGPTVAVLPYDAPGYGLLYDVSLGQGRALVLGDPSLLINFMRDVGDNAQLAANLFDALCEGRTPCQVDVVTGDRARVTGDPAGRRQSRRVRRRADELAESVQRSVSRLNAALQGLSEARPNRRGVYFAAVFLGLGICVFLFSALPLGKPRWLSFSLRLPRGVRSRSEFEWNLERLLEGGRNDDYGLPLAILKDEFEDVFLGALAQNSGELLPERRYDQEQMTRFARRFGERVAPAGSRADREAAAGRALATLKAMARIPTRNSLVPEVDGRYSERLLRRLYGEARRLLDELGILDRYERRAGRP